MITLHDISYELPNKECLFSNITFSVNKFDKIALVGNNGVGKSTLLKIIATELQASAGSLFIDTVPYFIPQVYGQYNGFSVAQALDVESKLNALKSILDGELSELNYKTLNDDWTIEERCLDALKYWQLTDVGLHQKMEELSGGQKTKVFLSGILIHQPEIVLLDEPSNHLDLAARYVLYDFIRSSSKTVLVVSHDRKLLNIVDSIYEMQRNKIVTYSGNYDFYQEQKINQQDALYKTFNEKLKSHRKAKEKERETIERQQKLDARGSKKQKEKGGVRIAKKTLKNNAENSTSKLKNTHSQKVENINKEIRELRMNLPEMDKMKFDFDSSNLHKGKILFKAQNLNHSYGNKPIWKKNLGLQILSGERIAVNGANGSGKTTLLKIIMGRLIPTFGDVYIAANCRVVYIDQEYSLIDNTMSVLQMAEKHNTFPLLEHEIKIRLDRFLFPRESWGKACSVLSGGERMRLILCCLNINNKAPDIIILDEPTNNLDIQNIEILTSVIKDYHGTLIVVSHDETFLKQIRVERELLL